MVTNISLFSIQHFHSAELIISLRDESINEKNPFTMNLCFRVVTCPACVCGKWAELRWLRYSLIIMASPM